MMTNINTIYIGQTPLFECNAKPKTAERVKPYCEIGETRPFLDAKAVAEDIKNANIKDSAQVNDTKIDMEAELENLRTALKIKDMLIQELQDEVTQRKQAVKDLKEKMRKDPKYQAELNQATHDLNVAEKRLCLHQRDKLLIQDRINAIEKELNRK